MSNTINPAFQEALRELGRPTTPEDLRRRGIQRLRSVTTSEVALLIERAVNRTLMERTIGPLEPVERTEILHAAETQFTRQLREFVDLAGSRQRLAQEIRACLQPLLPDRSPGGADRRVVEALRALTERHVAEALEHQRRGFTIETQNQERRVAKLARTLEQTEKTLARVAASKAIDPGIGSIYDSVQGLSAVDLAAERKKELLVHIFEANLALREARASAAQFA